MDAPTGRRARRRTEGIGTETSIAPPVPSAGRSAVARRAFKPTVPAQRGDFADTRGRAWWGFLSRVPHDQAAPQGARPGDRRGEQFRAKQGNVMDTASAT